MKLTRLPPKQGLYDPAFEHESCGVGFLVNINGTKSHKIVQDALRILVNLNHRGACGCEGVASGRDTPRRVRRRRRRGRVLREVRV